MIRRHRGRDEGIGYGEGLLIYDYGDIRMEEMREREGGKGGRTLRRTFWRIVRTSRGGGG